MKRYLTGLFAFIGILWMLFTDCEQRELYNISLGDAEDKGE